MCDTRDTTRDLQRPAVATPVFDGGRGLNGTTHNTLLLRCCCMQFDSAILGCIHWKRRLAENYSESRPRFAHIRTSTHELRLSLLNLSLLLLFVVVTLILGCKIRFQSAQYPVQYDTHTRVATGGRQHSLQFVMASFRASCACEAIYNHPRASVCLCV